MNISKSRYLAGLKCSKYLWFYVNKPESIPEPDTDSKFRFEQGHIVNTYAHKLFPKGISLQEEDFAKNLKETKEALGKRVPLFEAAVSTDNLYARVDILNPVGKVEWDIIEVKSSTSVKDEHIPDLAFQRFVFEKAGLKIHKCFLMHLNNQYVRKGEVKPKELFVQEDVTDLVKEAAKGMDERLKEMFKVVALPKNPEVRIGGFCSEPYGCPLMDVCWNDMPKNNVFSLYFGRKKGEELFNQGIISIKDIPDTVKLNDKQEIQRDCCKTGKTYASLGHIQQFLKTLHYPLYYLDFETFATAVPIYDGLKPHQAVTFQFSLHVVEKESLKPKHYEFLADGTGDPRKAFLLALKEVIGTSGSVVTYNAGFECGRLKELMALYPKEKWIQGVLDRVVDLLVPFRSFYYYNPDQEGSASIKSVLPALVGKGYDDLEIGEGGSASLAYWDIMSGKLTADEVKKKRAALLKYCERDTEAMVWVVERLSRLK